MSDCKNCAVHAERAFQLETERLNDNAAYARNLLDVTNQNVRLRSALEVELSAAKDRSWAESIARIESALQSRQENFTVAEDIKGRTQSDAVLDNPDKPAHRESEPQAAPSAQGAGERTGAGPFEYPPAASHSQQDKQVPRPETAAGVNGQEAGQPAQSEHVCKCRVDRVTCPHGRVLWEQPPEETDRSCPRCGVSSLTRNPDCGWSHSEPVHAAPDFKDETVAGSGHYKIERMTDRQFLVKLGDDCCSMWSPAPITFLVPLKQTKPDFQPKE